MIADRYLDDPQSSEGAFQDQFNGPFIRDLFDFDATTFRPVLRCQDGLKSYKRRFFDFSCDNKKSATGVIQGSVTERASSKPALFLLKLYGAPGETILVALVVVSDGFSNSPRYDPSTRTRAPTEEWAPGGSLTGSSIKRAVTTPASEIQAGLELNPPCLVVTGRGTIEYKIIQEFLPEAAA